ncbi:putative phosphatidylinositol-4-phosphate 5-kinase [Neospora caninum Liverpool]|uniref:Phosphatidylinositol-4-phosphate 5-kinase,putative n=1 Tax=Neospora caninum (strain Liverpool) TaxID=572307 RepID=F0VQ75_NEOCL|nr:putative phosphatidylinositol-4-phosphate 5-kinase [Neospora caninum Liverpool]CBZ55872.1 putative phosphatidylinositol-4-phosphate 5-kinase [Neospora caninum Liverpool]CEL70616.1 TPA: phosphatidylinositol-4-phosphate 5-kinase,putative [Neospora caninum Liverpool]|eukprot:XP_003885898.1 putative phosphatidylinositol-4-phosphate 5-kinase [Neospora caninum Liverpool]
MAVAGSSSPAQLPASMERNGEAVDAREPRQEASDDTQHREEGDDEGGLVARLASGASVATLPRSATRESGSPSATAGPQAQENPPTEQQTDAPPQSANLNGEARCGAAADPTAGSCTDTSARRTPGQSWTGRVAKISSGKSWAHKQVRIVSKSKRPGSRGSVSEAGSRKGRSRAGAASHRKAGSRSEPRRASLLTACLSRPLPSTAGTGEKVAGFHVEDIREVLKFLQGKASEPTFLLTEPSEKTLLCALSDPLVLLSFYLHLEQIRIGRVLAQRGHKAPNADVVNAQHFGLVSGDQLLLLDVLNTFFYSRQYIPKPRLQEFTHRLVDPCLLVLQPAGLISPALLPANLSLSGSLGAAGDTNTHLFLSSYHRYVHNFESNSLPFGLGVEERDRLAAGDRSRVSGDPGLAVIDENSEAKGVLEPMPSPGLWRARDAADSSAGEAAIEKEGEGRREGDKTDAKSLLAPAWKNERNEDGRGTSRVSSIFLTGSSMQDSSVRMQIEEAAQCSAQIKVLLTGSEGREMEVARTTFLRTCMKLLIEQLLPPWTFFVERVLPAILRDIHDPNVIVQKVVMDKLWRLRKDLEAATGTPCGFTPASNPSTQVAGVANLGECGGDLGEPTGDRTCASAAPSRLALSADSLSVSLRATDLSPVDGRDGNREPSRGLSSDISEREEDRPRRVTLDDRREGREGRSGDSRLASPSERRGGSGAAAAPDHSEAPDEPTETAKRMHVSLSRPASVSSCSSPSHAATISPSKRGEAGPDAGEGSEAASLEEPQSLAGSLHPRDSLPASGPDETYRQMRSTSSTASNFSISRLVPQLASGRSSRRRGGPSPSRASPLDMCSSPARLSPVGQAAEALEDFALTNLSSRPSPSRGSKSIPMSLRLVKRNALTQTQRPGRVRGKGEEEPSDVGGNAVREDSPFYALTFAMMLGLQMSSELSACLVMLRHKLGSSVDLEFLLDEPLLLPVRQFHFCCYPQLPRPFFCVFEDIAPDTFECARELAGVTEQDYRSSMCRTDFSFIEFESNSKSGQFFLFSHDGKYLIKTISLREVKQVLKILPAYIDHLLSNPNSLLTRLFGLHRVEIYKRYDLVDDDELRSSTQFEDSAGEESGYVSPEAGSVLTSPREFSPGDVESHAREEGRPGGDSALPAEPGAQRSDEGHSHAEAAPENAAPTTSEEAPSNPNRLTGASPPSPGPAQHLFGSLESAGSAHAETPAQEEAGPGFSGKAERQSLFKDAKRSLKNMRDTVRTSLRPVAATQGDAVSVSDYAFTLPRSVRYSPEHATHGEDHTFLSGKNAPKDAHGASHGESEASRFRGMTEEGQGGIKGETDAEKAKRKRDGDCRRGRLPFLQGSKKKSDSHKALRHAKSRTYAVRDDAKKQSVTCAYFAVIGTAFDPFLGLHEAYDLKGSTVSRRAKPDDRVKKDVDWLEAGRRLDLRDEEAQTILRAHRLDCEFLETISVFDYSLLVGVHRCKRGVLSRAGSQAASAVEGQPARTPPSAMKSSMGPLRQYTKIQQHSLLTPSQSLLSQPSAHPLSADPAPLLPLLSAGGFAGLGVQASDGKPIPKKPSAQRSLSSASSAEPDTISVCLASSSSTVDERRSSTLAGGAPAAAQGKCFETSTAGNGEPENPASLAWLPSSAAPTLDSRPPAVSPGAYSVAPRRCSSSGVEAAPTRPCLRLAANHAAERPTFSGASGCAPQGPSGLARGGSELEDDTGSLAETACPLQRADSIAASSASSFPPPRCYSAHVSMPCPLPSPRRRRVTMKQLTRDESRVGRESPGCSNLGCMKDAEKDRKREGSEDGQTVRSVSQSVSWPDDRADKTRENDELSISRSRPEKHAEPDDTASPATSRLPYTETAYTFLDKSWMGTAFMSLPSPDSGFGVKVMNADMTEIYYLGIIDFLTPYDWRRYGHTVYKRVKSSFKCEFGEISPMPPAYYSRRQQAFLRDHVVQVVHRENSSPEAPTTIERVNLRMPRRTLIRLLKSREREFKGKGAFDYEKEGRLDDAVAAAEAGGFCAQGQESDRWRRLSTRRRRDSQHRGGRRQKKEAQREASSPCGVNEAAEATHGGETRVQAPGAKEDAHPPEADERRKKECRRSTFYNLYNLVKL